MTSPLKLRSGFPEAPRSCSPRWSTLSGERPCVSSDFWCCCFSFCSSAASGSCWTLTAACRRHRGRITRRVWTKDSLITPWCEEEGRGRRVRVNIHEELLHGDCFCGKTKWNQSIEIIWLRRQKRQNPALATQKQCWRCPYCVYHITE